MDGKNKFIFPLVVLYALLPFTGWSQVKLPRLISDGMILQRDTKVKIWGWAAANEKITVQFQDSTYQSNANVKGEWEIILPPLPAGGPYPMTLKASNTIHLQDILVGDVWICSGQSNMELPMRRVKPLYEKEIASAHYPDIRYFEVPKQYDFNKPRTDLSSGQWQKITPANVLSFSAVAYFFAKELTEKYHVPIGLINTSLGGSPAEAWISEEALKEFPVHYQEAQRFKDTALIHHIERQDRERIQAWYKKLNQQDKGLQNPEKKWSDPSLSIAQWPGMEVPGYWANTAAGPVNGAVWFRKEITVPASMINQVALLHMGRIVDADSVFVNGQFVGTTSYQYPPRWYTVPAGVLKEGKNTIAVKVINERGTGGFVPDKPYTLTAGKQTIDLKGKWQYQVGAVMEPLASQTFVRWKPVGLYNAMISPLLNYSMKGVIWYQGESNADRPQEYRTLFPAMIKNWRKQWKQGDFPFLFVQLANFMEAKKQPSESNWALLREAQTNTLALPHTGMAVTIDIGEWNDIHPLNKKDVGHRLALAAQKVAYGAKLVEAGPIYESMKIENGKVIISFKSTGSGLMAKGKELTGFALAGTDNTFEWAKAEIIGKQVVVWSEKVTKPVAVRYAWADNPQGANLYNKEGLPASPFRTDTFSAEETR